MAPLVLQFATLDVFTSNRFEGNPLALVKVPKGSSLTQEQKQAIAREFNLSETVFLHDEAGSPDGRRLDIFIPTAEIPFAGHPTIGTLCYIGRHDAGVAAEGMPTRDIKLAVKAGQIKARFSQETGFAEADIPHSVHVHSSTIDMPSILESQPRLTGITNEEQGTPAAKSFPLVSIVKGMTFVLIELATLDHLSACYNSGRDIRGLQSRLDEAWSHGVVGQYFYTTLPRDEDGSTRIRTRMFEPSMGEDPATGSAACALASYLALETGGADRVHKFEIVQGVEMGRESVIRVTVILDGTGKAVGQVLISGQAVLVMKGTIEV